MPEFFLNSESVEENDQPAVSGAVRQPLFRQDAPPDQAFGSHLSLSAYISKHLEAAERPLDEKPATPVGFGGNPFVPLTEARNAERPQGQFLNSLDVELVAGLEQYMPTPLFRLRVIKKRLDMEIAELRMRLNKYERLPDPPPALQEKIAIIRRRIETLEAHDRQVSRQLSTALTLGPVFARCIQGYQEGKSHLEQGVRRLVRAIKRLAFGPAHEEMDILNGRLLALSDMLQDQMRDVAITEAEISHIITQYEQTVRQMEQVSARMGSTSLWQRLWQPARSLVK